MNWTELLDQAIRDNPRGVTGVAENLAISRPALSMVINGTYPAKTDKIAAKVLAFYDRLVCPHTAERITRAECRSLADRPAPTSSPRDMRHWRACRDCPYQEGNHANARAE